MDRGSYFSCLYSVREALGRLEKSGLDQASVDMYKSALLDRYKSRQDDPDFWVDMISMRISTGKNLEEKARFIANKTLKEALHGLTLEELKVSQEVLRKIFHNTQS